MTGSISSQTGTVRPLDCLNPLVQCCKSKKIYQFSVFPGSTTSKTGTEVDIASRLVTDWIPFIFANTLTVATIRHIELGRPMDLTKV